MSFDTFDNEFKSANFRIKNVICDDFTSTIGYVSSVRVGGGFLGIWKRALIGWTSESGGDPSASSMAVMPKDQTSHLGKNFHSFLEFLNLL